MKYKFLITILALITVVIVKAQSDSAVHSTKISFENSVHDFGTVNEGGYIKHDFVFKNTGNAPLVVTMVRASCGCTTPFWTKEPILPGQTGVITAQYNTINRPGVFTKTLTVTGNTEPAMTVLTIKGNVLPKVKSPEELYPKKIGPVRTFSDFVYLGKISTKEPVMKQITLYNEGTEPITFSTHEVPPYMEISFTPQTIGPKEKTVVKILYNALKRNELGPVEDKVIVLTNAKEENKIILNLQADITEYYAPVPDAEKENVPKATLETSTLDFGTLKPNISASKEISITNNGKQDLDLKKIRSGPSYILIKPEKAIIKPGHTLKIKVTYKSGGNTGPDSQYIWIHSNDPMQPTQSISIKAHVLE